MANRPKLGELLIEARLLDDSRLRTALSDQSQWGRPLGATLVKLGFVDEHDMVRILSQQLKIPFTDLEGKRVEEEVLALLTHEVALKYRCLPLVVCQDGAAKQLYVALCDPLDLTVLDQIGFLASMDILPVLVGESQLEQAIDVNYRKRETHSYLEPFVAEDITSPGEEASTAAKAASPSEPEVMLEDEVEDPVELEVGERTIGSPRGAVASSGQPLNANVLQALIQLLIAQGTIDGSELIQRIVAMGDADR